MIAHEESVMGTVFSFLIEPRVVELDLISGAILQACSELHDLDRMFSLWIQDSPMSKLRRGELRDVPTLIDDVLELCALATEISGGWFDPWASPGGVDPTGLVKGWAAERVLGHLTRVGVDHCAINAGGDVAILSETAWRIGIQDPFSKDRILGIVESCNSIATSGTYERQGHLYHPWGGDIAAVSATVVGGGLAIADALATAIVVGGRPVLDYVEVLDGVEAFCVLHDGSVYRTSGLTLLSE